MLLSSWASGDLYLGAKAVIEAMSGSFDAYSGTKVVFAGNNVSEDYLYELQAFLKDKKFGICVISKSGTTTEPAVAFRLLKDQLIEQEGVTVARERIVAITDEKREPCERCRTGKGTRLSLFRTMSGDATPC